MNGYVSPDLEFFVSNHWRRGWYFHLEDDSNDFGMKNFPRLTFTQFAGCFVRSNLLHSSVDAVSLRSIIKIGSLIKHGSHLCLMVLKFLFDGDASNAVAHAVTHLQP